MRAVELMQEVQWVLHNARLNAADPELRSAAGFATGGGRVPAVHRSQVGRWERGHVEVTYGLVRRYEKTLGLPTGVLLTAVDLFARARHPVRAVGALPRREPPDVVETLDLLERALSDERMTGLDWDLLSDSLGRMPHALVRTGDWEAVLRRLLEEANLRLRLGYAQRSEALARLAGHPRSGPVVGAMAAEVTTRPDSPFYHDTLGLLRFTDHPEAVSVVLDQLREPTSPATLRACLVVLATLVRARRLAPDVRLEAAHLAVQHLRESGHPYRVHRSAATLVRELGVGGPRLAHVLTAQDRRAAASIVRDGRAVGKESVRRAHLAIRREIEREAGPVAAADPVLARLLDTALGETNDEERSSALAVLMISSPAPAVGRVEARVLGEALGRGDHVQAHEALTVLSWLGQEPDLDLVTTTALDPRLPPDLTADAAFVVGNTPERRGAARDGRERAVAARLAQVAAAGGDHTVGEQVRGLVYVLGMRGRLDLLAALADTLPRSAPGAPATTADTARSLAAYWLSMPAQLRPVADGEVVPRH